jgi:hypothetical protein
MQNSLLKLTLHQLGESLRTAARHPREKVLAGGLHVLRKRFTSPYRGEHTVLPQPGSGNDFAAGFP